MKHPVYIIQGAQWGSEGKGQIAALYAQKVQAQAVVRTGSINAGHTVWHKDREYKMQLLPTAWASSDTPLILGPGCFIHRKTLARELTEILQATGRDIRDRLYIDYRCTTHESRHETAAVLSGRHYSIGSTSKGSSDAAIERMTARRDLEQSKLLLFRNNPWAGTWDLEDCLADTSALLKRCLDDGPIVIEGTQGAHLDSFLGPWPFTTNRAVSTSAWLAYAGLPPTLDVRPILVARTYPIRVAGNSGPMPGETTWNHVYHHMLANLDGAELKFPRVPLACWVAYEMALSQLIAQDEGPNKLICDWSEDERRRHSRLLSEAPTVALSLIHSDYCEMLLKFVERTTVTHKIRRVAEWDPEVVQQAIDWNGCHGLWITFLNYRFPTLWGVTDVEKIVHTAGPWLDDVERKLQVQIAGVTTERHPSCHLTL